MEIENFSPFAMTGAVAAGEGCRKAGKTGIQMFCFSVPGRLLHSLSRLISILFNILNMGQAVSFVTNDRIFYLPENQLRTFPLLPDGSGQEGWIPALDRYVGRKAGRRGGHIFCHSRIVEIENFSPFAMTVAMADREGCRKAGKNRFPNVLLFSPKEIASLTLPLDFDTFQYF